MRDRHDWLDQLLWSVKGQIFHTGGPCQVCLAGALCKGCTAVVSVKARPHMWHSLQICYSYYLSSCTSSCLPFSLVLHWLDERWCTTQLPWPGCSEEHASLAKPELFPHFVSWLRGEKSTPGGISESARMKRQAVVTFVRESCPAVGDSVASSSAPG